LQQNLPRHLAMLERMVGINSFTANPAGVNELGLLTAEIFAPLGFTAETIQSANPLFGCHLILTREGRKVNGRPAPKIGLVSHLDTVFPAAEEQRNDFCWQRQGERIYGPGTVDIKGGTIMIHMILSALRELFPQQFEAVTWVILFDASEETSSRDFGRICVDRVTEEALACLIFEPGNWLGERPYIAVARKGMAIFRVEVEGKSAHAGSAHEQGANAIVQLAEVIERLSKMTDYERRLTVNVGTVAGGTVTNRVPHFASANLEMRAFDNDVFLGAVADILALNELSTVSSHDGAFSCRVKVEMLTKVFPWPPNPRTDRLFQVWQSAAGALGYQALAEERAGLSDGNYFWHQLPTLDGLGPAGGNAHCSERSEDGSKEPEYVLASSFVPKALLNTMAILRLIDRANE
jgi:glutamate carboxypeptidase